MRLDLALLGAPKCGTTAMTRYLGAHPGLFMADKDLHRYGRDLPFRGRPRTTAAEWAAAFAGARPDQLRAESSVWYLLSETAAAEIAAAHPEARALVLLRDPVQAMYAHWAQLRFNAYGHEDQVDFAGALALEPDRAAGRRVPAGMPLPLALRYRHAFTFGPQVARARAAFGDRLRVVLQEDLAADTAGVVRETFAWLGLDPDLPIDPARVNTAKAVRSEGLRRALRAVPEAWKARLPRGLRLGLRGLARRANTRHAPRPPLDHALRRRLEDDLRDDVRALEALLGRPLLAPEGPWFGPAEEPP